jgi:hypothetical protein
MPLPEGRKPLSNEDLAKLMRTMDRKNKRQSTELLEEILETLRDIKRSLDELSGPQIPVYPPARPAYPPYLGSATTCPKCGMVWEGVMSYSCMHSDCPVQYRVTWDYPSATTGQFSVESLDPAERSWYYDGDGTRRSKSQQDE